jgi:hypothetical protein
MATIRISAALLIKTQFNVTVKRTRSDNEYNSNRLQKFIDKEGMLWEPTVAYNPHESGVSEPSGQNTFGLRSFPKSLARIAGDSRLVSQNQNNHQLSQKSDPFERLFNRKPDLSHLSCQEIPEENDRMINCHKTVV